MVSKFLLSRFLECTGEVKQIQSTQATQVSVKLKWEKVPGRREVPSAITGISPQQRDHLNLILNDD